jgi:hypothetical protein
MNRERGKLENGRTVRRSRKYNGRKRGSATTST